MAKGGEEGRSIRVLLRLPNHTIGLDIVHLDESHLVLDVWPHALEEGELRIGLLHDEVPTKEQVHN